MRENMLVDLLALTELFFCTYIVLYFSCIKVETVSSRSTLLSIKKCAQVIFEISALDWLGCSGSTTLITEIEHL